MNTKPRKTSRKTKATRLFYIELTARSASGGRPDQSHIYLPVRYAWQEDPKDLHIQLNTPDGKEHLNICPATHKSGDYIIPNHPWLEKHLGFEPTIVHNHNWCTGPEIIKHDGILIYHLGWVPKLEPKTKVAPKAYIELLESLWYSPNR